MWFPETLMRVNAGQQRLLLVLLLQCCIIQTETSAGQNQLLEARSKCCPKIHNGFVLDLVVAQVKLL